MQYKVGTVTVANNSPTVTGSGTAFLGNVTVGSLFTVAGSGVPYIVGNVVNDTQLTLASNYAGVGASGLSYAITTSFTPNHGLPYPEQTDIDTHTIVKRAMTKIDTLLGSSIGSASHANRVVFTDASGNQKTSDNLKWNDSSELTINSPAASPVLMLQSAGANRASIRATAASQLQFFDSGGSVMGTWNNTGVTIPGTLTATSTTTIGASGAGTSLIHHSSSSGNHVISLRLSGTEKGQIFAAASDMHYYAGVGISTKIYGDNAVVATFGSASTALTGTLSTTGNVTLGDAVGDAHTVNGALTITDDSTTALVVARSAGGDLFRVGPDTAGNGVNIFARNSADGDYEPLALRAEFTVVRARDGANSDTEITRTHVVSGAGVFDIKETGNAGTLLRFLGSGTKFNWLIGKQFNVDDKLEITPSTAAGGTTFTTPVITISSTGFVTIAAASGTNNALSVKNDGGANAYTTVIWNAATTGDNLFTAFATEAGQTVRGSITYNRGGGLVAYNTTSDHRLKFDFGRFDPAEARAQLAKLIIHKGQMMDAALIRPMFFAHEAQQVVPYAVGGEKDERGRDGWPKYQTMDHSILVPLLTAGWQDHEARLARLESRIPVL